MHEEQTTRRYREQLDERRSRAARPRRGERRNMNDQVRRGLVWLVGRTGEDDGQAMIEYALLVSLIAIVSFAILQVLGVRVASLYTSVFNQLPTP
jgi:Flp pilus assembly pilin Flp